jgi:hypothetical protein
MLALYGEQDTPVKRSSLEDVGMARTANIGVRVEPALKEAAEKAAAADHRSVASLLEKLLTEYLEQNGFVGPPRSSRGSGSPRRRKVEVAPAGELRAGT